MSLDTTVPVAFREAIPAPQQAKASTPTPESPSEGHMSTTAATANTPAIVDTKAVASDVLSVLDKRDAEKATAAKITGLETDLASAKASNETLTGENTKLKLEVATANASVETKTKELDAANTAKATAEAKVTALTTELDTAKASLAKIELESKELKAVATQANRVKLLDEANVPADHAFRTQAIARDEKTKDFTISDAAFEQTLAFLKPLIAPKGDEKEIKGNASTTTPPTTPSSPLPPDMSGAAAASIAAGSMSSAKASENAASLRADMATSFGI